MTDLERLAEACERAAAELSIECLRCYEYPESMSMCDYCQRRKHDAAPLRALAHAIRAGRVTVQEEPANG